MGKKKINILIIDDDEDVLLTAKMILRPHYAKIKTASNPKQLSSLLREEDIHVIILDMNFKAGATSGNEGLFWLREINGIDPSIKVIMNTAYGDIQLAVECMKDGAADFLVKPWEKEKLLATVGNVVSLHESEKRISHLEATKEVLTTEIEHDLGELIGNSPAMVKIAETISKVAGTDANILISGENGTGKELVARAIHNQSKRVKQNFVKVDVGALSESLFESELFGHTKGAFTDAKNDRPGRFELANEGTLFLDEISNITEGQQVKLLSALQNRQVTRLGANKPVDVDIRLICATNKQLSAEVDEGNFRQDLLYRINTIELNLPPLRKRTGDIELLASHFLQQFGEKYNKYGLALEQSAINKLNDYNWPGNIRELQHAIERAVILADSKTLSADAFVTRTTSTKTSHSDSLNVEDVERETILLAIEKYDGNLTRASNELGMGRSTLYRKMKRYNIKG